MKKYSARFIVQFICMIKQVQVNSNIPRIMCISRGAFNYSHAFKIAVTGNNMNGINTIGRDQVCTPLQFQL
jgi:L-arabinose isomerase